MNKEEQRQQIYKEGAKHYVDKLIRCKDSFMGVRSNMDEQEYECLKVQEMVYEEVKKLLKEHDSEINLGETDKNGK